MSETRVTASRILNIKNIQHAFLGLAELYVDGLVVISVTHPLVVIRNHPAPSQGWVVTRQGPWEQREGSDTDSHPGSRKTGKTFSKSRLGGSRAVPLDGAGGRCEGLDDPRHFRTQDLPEQGGETPAAMPRGPSSYGSFFFLITYHRGLHRPCAIL